MVLMVCARCGGGQRSAEPGERAEIRNVLKASHRNLFFCYTICADKQTSTKVSALGPVR